MATFFPEVKSQVAYEGPATKNPLAFKWYDRSRKVRGKTMEQHLRFAVAYWHTFKGTGADPFGGGVYERPWAVGATPMEVAHKTLEACFEFCSKLGAPYYCFHDTDVAPEEDGLPSLFRNLEELVAKAKKLQKQTGVKLLWGTANLFSHARYSNGAATNPDPHVFACAAAQVRHALEATVTLGGTGYVFWGGREGYSSILNTNMKQEREQLAALLHMAVAHGKKIGFKGKYFIEPKPKEPSKHQYDFDAATVIGFLREFGLLEHFMLNVEANHATLAGHTFEHELEAASQAGLLGSLDINTGDPTLGWDTDEFATDLKSSTLAALILLRQGGLKFGGLNFDAKVRRGSFDTVDLFHAHISGMDTFARALLVADQILKDGVFETAVAGRYKGFRTGLGKKILAGKTDLLELETWALKQGEPARISGRQEALERTLAEYLYDGRIV